MRVCARSHGTSRTHRSSRSCTTSCSGPTATLWPTPALPPARPATGGRCSPSSPTCSSTASTLRAVPEPQALPRSPAARDSGRPAPGGRAAVSSCSRSTASRAGRSACRRRRSRRSPAWSVANVLRRDRARGARLHGCARLRRGRVADDVFASGRRTSPTRRSSSSRTITALYEMHATMKGGARSASSSTAATSHHRGHRPRGCLRARRRSEHRLPVRVSTRVAERGASTAHRAASAITKRWRMPPRPGPAHHHTAFAAGAGSACVLSS